MPFIGRDWRSPGEAWVKTESLGWQRMKLFESQLQQSCHQNPACSWPPRGEYGQHMNKNCRDLGEYHNNVSSSTSSETSRGNSLSPSPTSSPEKNLRHVYPLTISSPYGKYSYCPNHAEFGQMRSGCDTDMENCPSDTQIMTRSLSRECVRSDLELKPVQKLRYNHSVSDFRASTTSNDRAADEAPNSSQTAGDVISSSDNKLEIPSVLRNGLKIDDPVSQVGSGNDSLGQQLQSPSSCCCHHAHNIRFPNESPLKTAPHCRISVKTREVAMYNTISEAFYRLDFCNAIHDIRRFNYICKLLHLLITQNLTSLSGCATKVLFTMLEQVAWEVSSNKRNIHVLKNLLNELKQMIQKYYCWGRPIGSSLLWQQHFDTIERIGQIVDGIELSPPKSDTPQMTFNNLPVEMIREILLRLNDYRDLVSSAQASPVMRTMVDSQYIWKKLCNYHFTEQQLKMALENNRDLYVEKSSARGVKYSRTTSADGLSSYRNPVTHKPKRALKTRQQLEQTTSRRGQHSRHIDKNDLPSTSYVTRAIQIFDKESTSVPLGSTKVKKTTTNKQVKVNSTSRASQQSETESQENADRLSHEIDWKRVFHQLRKKFDLREEYADCLLLCRHCRCLFWKSFGHPCIEQPLEPTKVTNGGSNLEQTLACSSNQVPMAEADRSMNNADGSVANEERRQIVNQNQRRLSVAMLSRSFDTRAQVSNQAVVNNENQAPVRPPMNENWPNRRPLNQRHDNSIRRPRNDQSTQGPSSRRPELTPKHIAISPQAFLKFFSL